MLRSALLTPEAGWCWGKESSLSCVRCSSESVGEQGCLEPQAGSPGRSCALCKTHVLQNQGSTLILTYLEEIIKIQSRSCSDKAKSRASMLLIFILVLQLFIFLDDFSALCILLCTDLSKVALWLLQSSISQSILLLFWVSHPFQVGCVMTINIIINMRGNISHNQEPSVWREMFIIHNLLGSVNQPGSLCYSIMHH